MVIDPIIGRRHLLGTDGLLSDPNSRHSSVRIIVEHAWANSVAGQLIATCLVNLLSRQVGLVERLELVSPSVSSLIAALSPRRSKPSLNAYATWVSGLSGWKSPRAHMSPPCRRIRL
jgi:hypothetical protein